MTGVVYRFAHIISGQHNVSTYSGFPTMNIKPLSIALVAFSLSACAQSQVVVEPAPIPVTAKSPNSGTAESG